jgi:AcrR family transcriptional regulator
LGRRRTGEPVKTKQDRFGIRTRLLRAGAELFASCGLHPTQVADVAKRAGVSVGGFYRYFRDKDELYRELVRARFEQYLEALSGLNVGLESSTLSERMNVVRSVFRQTLTMHLEDRDTFLLWYRYGYGVSDEVNAIVDDFTRKVEELISEMLDRSITVGDMLDEPTRRLVATSMVGIVNTVAHRMIVTGDDDVEHATEVCTRIVAGGLLALAPPQWQKSLISMYAGELGQRSASSPPRASDPAADPAEEEGSTTARPSR